MAKRAMAVIVAFSGVLLCTACSRLGLRRSAFSAVLAACLGSDLWTVGSQAAWQHGPAALGLVTTMCALATTAHDPSPAGTRGAGDHGRFHLPLDGRSVRPRHRRLARVDQSPRPSVVLAGADCGRAWSCSVTISGFSGPILGGQARLEEYHVSLHGVSGTWSTNLLDGVLGTLFSPNRGLLVFSPWIAVAIAGLWPYRP